MKKIIRCILLISIIFIPSFILALEKININNPTHLDIIYKYDDILLPSNDINIYHIASISSDNQYQIDKNFSSYNIEINDLFNNKNIADTINFFIQRDNIIPNYPYKTDEFGKISINNIPIGVYLIVANKLYLNEYTYISKPIIVSIPTFNNNIWEYDVSLLPKISREKEEQNNKFISKRIMISWSDNNNYLSTRPNSLKIKLLRDGVMYDEVFLNEENNWQYTWNKLPAFEPNGIKYIYEIIQENLENYNVIFSENGSVFSITNTYNKNSNIPKEEKLPKLGLYLWPIPLLYILGLIFIIIGTIIYRKENE